MLLPIPETFETGSVQVNVEYFINKYGTLRNGIVSAEDLSEVFRLVSDDLQERSALFFVQDFSFAIFFRNRSLYIFDSHSRNSVGFQTTSGASVLLGFLSYDNLSAYIHQCYICNVDHGSDSNRELQYEIQFVKVSTTRQFVSESLKFNITRTLNENITPSRKRLPLQIFLRKVKRPIM